MGRVYFTTRDMKLLGEIFEKISENQQEAFDQIEGLKSRLTEVEDMAKRNQSRTYHANERLDKLEMRFEGHTHSDSHRLATTPPFCYQDTKVEEPEKGAKDES